ncbi:LysR family transcriptional regulator [Jeotgalibaca sp. MA1X17-3]|uniref:LysR family transcriptional regulator n=1 Tax=Jeotgalibaca sp. MA1X17-3 TaxID=2908211 RepID=UPI001F30F528|nr:LysR family transcriptional regulator [Jeotgalibaca sp. MA1X17-3]UJF16066.1 LysR family transcriptional regulator [Jeotgalibaca sp. MA1X17-3]
MKEQDVSYHFLERVILKLELRQLRYFLAIANAKSYSAAAQNLFVTQPTLTWNIQKLEEELDTRLFYQTTRGIELTESGEILFEEGKNILSNVDDMLEHIQLRGDNQKKTLKVGITALFVIQYMDQIVNYISSNPEVELTFIQHGSVVLQKMLANKEIDLGLLSFPIYEPSIEIEKLRTSNPNYKISVVVPPDHPLAAKKSIKFPDLEGYEICSFTKDYVLGKILYERCEAFGFTPNVIFTNNNWEVLLKNIEATRTLTLMPDVIKKIRKDSELKWIPLVDKASEFNVGIAKLKETSLSEPAVRFIECIREN